MRPSKFPPPLPCLMGIFDPLSSALFSLPCVKVLGLVLQRLPPLLIQREHPSLLLEDLYQLLMAGKLKRTFGGIEYAVPLSPSTGAGDLKKNLISSDVKARAGFCPGLIASLEIAGLLDPKRPIEEKGGSGSVFY